MRAHNIVIYVYKSKSQLIASSLPSSSPSGFGNKFHRYSYVSYLMGDVKKLLDLGLDIKFKKRVVLRAW